MLGSAARRQATRHRRGAAAGGRSESERGRLSPYPLHKLGVEDQLLAIRAHLYGTSNNLLIFCCVERILQCPLCDRGGRFPDRGRLTLSLGVTMRSLLSRHTAGAMAILNVFRLAAVLVVFSTIGPFALADSHLGVRQPAPLILPVPPSRILAPLSVNMAELQAALNAAAPNTVHGSQHDPITNSAVKDDVLTWNAHRAAISVREANGRLVINVPARGAVRIRGAVQIIRGSIGNLLGSLNPTRVPFSVHADLVSVFEASLLPTLRPNWTIDPNARATARVTRATVPIKQFGSISVRSHVQPVLNQKLQQALGQLTNRLADPNLLKRPLVREWNRICTIIPIEGNVPNLWLVVKPRRVLAAQPQVYAQGVSLVLGLEGEISVRAQSTRPMAPHCPLPERLHIGPVSPSGEMALAVPVVVTWDWLRSELERALAGPLELNGLGQITLSNISIEPDGAGVLIGAYVDTLLIDRRIWIGARPVLDLSEKNIRFDDLTIDVESRSLLDVPLTTGASTILLRKLRPLAVIDYSSHEEQFVDSARATLHALVTELRSRAQIIADIRTILLKDIIVGAEGIFLLAAGSGSLRIDDIRLTSRDF